VNTNKTEEVFYFDDANLNCEGCQEIVSLGFDLNNDVRWFDANGTNFCGKLGRENHHVYTTRACVGCGEIIFRGLYFDGTPEWQDMQGRNYCFNSNCSHVWAPRMVRS